MAKKINVDTLKISNEAKERLTLSGIDFIEELNTFNLVELETLLGESFDEVLPYLRKYGIPSQLTELKLSNDTIELLQKNNIRTLSDLFNFDKYSLFDLLKDDGIILQEINNLFNTYQLTLLDAAQFGEMAPVVGEINLDERIRKEITPIRKGYGSRAYSHFKVRIASPNEILQWSYGEVLNHETINYRTSKPENGGLFCERIFGPTRDYQCHCGKKQSGNKGQICQKCGVEITESKVRRERMGHIKLQAPVVHTWYLKNSPSRLAILLGIKAKSLEEIVYHASYIVTDPGRAPVRKKDLLTEIQYSELQDTYGRGFVALTGAEAVKKLLQEINLGEEITSLRKKIHNSSKQKREAIIKRLEVLEAFDSSDNKPEWMVMDVIPVLPPDLRPMVQLDGGRFATTDLNDLYRRILNRNARLQKQIDQMAPRLIVKNEKRMLQEAVDALFDNAKRGRKAAVERNRSLKSLSDLLRGKQGRFRQNLLGKRVDYSGRSVIVVGPDLEMHQAGIPRDMALTLFKPFVLRELQKDPEVEKRNANQIYERREDRVWAALDVVIAEHPILLNRAPTLHRLGIQAFEPKLIDGKAIRIHPLVTPAFNADFDGDQMAVHVPLSPEAIAESRLLMLSSNNILNPKDGKPVVTPSQDMVLGNYYLTIEEQRDRLFYTDVKKTNVDDQKVAKHRHKHRNEGMFFSGAIEAKLAYENKVIDLHTRIFLKPNSLKQTFTKEQQEKYLVTTVGKIIFNEILPESFPYINEPTVYNLEEQTPDYYFMDAGVVPTQFLANLVETLPFKKRFLSQIIARIFKLFHITETSKMLDKLKDLGFAYSTIAGFTISYDDINVYSNKEALVDETNNRVEEIKEQYEMGLITNEERRKLIINEWQDVRSDIQEGLMKELDKDNNLYMMSDSGARGSIQNFSQLAGMRGLMNNPKGDIIEVPVQASFIEGLSVSEFFISTHGARKGSTDTALKTAESGYLTRRLVDVSQDVIVVEDDCMTERGILVDPILENDKVIVPLKDRIIGRYTSAPVFDLKTGEVIIENNTLISEETANEIIANGHEEIHIRSILTCDTNHGVCTKCYGINLATNSHVEVGEAVGVVAAQSIGEPGTQLTMRTFHTGGVASVGDITQGLPRIQELFEARNPKGKAVISESSGVVKAINRRQGVYTITIHDQKDQEYKYPLDPNVEPIVDKGDNVFAGQRMSPGSINPKDLLRVAGVEVTQRYILEEVQKVYRSQSVEISDKHIEVIIRQMLQRIDVKIEGDTNLLPGTEVSVTKFKQANAQAIKERKRLAVGQPILLGITRASLRSDSFLSAASFQETTRILTDAVINGKVDELHGLKENVIIGGLIPAGTGILQDSFFDYNPTTTTESSVEEK